MFFLLLLDDDEERAFLQRLYDDFSPLMLKTAMTYLKDQYKAEDAVHDSFISVCRNISTVRSLTFEQQRKYMMVVAKNASLNALKRENRLSSLDDVVLPSPSAESKAVEESAADSIIAVIKALPEIYRDALYFSIVLELSVKEIASSLGITKESAKKRIQRGRAMLIENLEKEGFRYEK